MGGRCALIIADLPQAAESALSSGARVFAQSLHSLAADLEPPLLLVRGAGSHDSDHHLGHALGASVGGQLPCSTSTGGLSKFAEHSAPSRLPSARTLPVPAAAAAAKGAVTGAAALV